MSITHYKFCTLGKQYPKNKINQLQCLLFINLVVTDIIELQNKLIATQEQLSKALEQNNAPSQVLDAGLSQP